MRLKALTLTLYPIKNLHMLSAKLAISHGASIIIMDDGLQNNSLHKDLSLLVVDTLQGFGNGRVFPAGPLRESPQRGVRKAS